MASLSISPAQSSRSWLKELAFDWVALSDDQSSAILKHEVTVAQYRLCVKAGICAPAAAPRITRQRYGECLLNARHLDQNDQRPINCISYQDALQFAHWVDGLYREASTPSSILKAQSTPLTQLPTRDDWLQAWGKRTYPWGDESPTCQRVVYFESAPACGGTLAPTPVCSRAEGLSDRGVCDLSGNLWEWVFNSSPQNYADQPSARPSANIIGGGWSSSNYDLTRGKMRTRSPQTRAPHIGMRLVLKVSPNALP
jgi:formylglycine-generating enzyme required for sulfatase activity